MMDVSGPWIVGSMSFLISALVALGFWYKIELAQAISLMAVPLSLVFILSARNARLIRANGTYGVALRAKLTRQRFFNQVIGLISIFITAFWGMWYNMNVSVL
jgi:hypothetical protein